MIYTHGNQGATAAQVLKGRGNAAPSIPTRAHLDEFFARHDPDRDRNCVIFALDATASRQPTWDMAAPLTAKMFETVAAIGKLDIQLVYYRGPSECVASRLLSVVSRYFRVCTIDECRYRLCGITVAPRMPIAM